MFEVKKTRVKISWNCPFNRSCNWSTCSIPVLVSCQMLVSDNPGDKTCPNKETETVSKVNNVGGRGWFYNMVDICFCFVQNSTLFFYFILLYILYWKWKGEALGKIIWQTCSNFNCCIRKIFKAPFSKKVESKNSQN